MSHDIEYNHLAITVPFTERARIYLATALGEDSPYDSAEQSTLHSPTNHVVFFEHGANNVSRMEYRNNRRIEVAARDWALFCVGNHYAVMHKVVSLAIHVHNGNIALAGKGRDATPESYIRAYRTALDRAPPSEFELERLGGITIEVPYSQAEEGNRLHPWLSLGHREGWATATAGKATIQMPKCADPDFALQASARVAVAAWLCDRLKPTEWCYTTKGSLYWLSDLQRLREAKQRRRSA